MFHFYVTVSVECTPAKLFGTLTDFGAIPQYVPEVRAAEQTSPGPPGVGAVFVQHLRYLGLPREVPTVVTMWEEPNRFGYRASRPPQYSAEYHLSEQGSLTLLAASVTVTPTGPWRLVEPIIRWRMPSIYRANLARLKVMVEAK